MSQMRIHHFFGMHNKKFGANGVTTVRVQLYGKMSKCHNLQGRIQKYGLGGA